MYALKLLMQSLGSPNIDCRQDGAALDPSFGRGSYVFNPTIEGIEQADAVLIIGANPRFEASRAQCPHPQALADGRSAGRRDRRAVDPRYPYVVARRRAGIAEGHRSTAVATSSRC